MTATSPPPPGDPTLEDRVRAVEAALGALRTQLDDYTRQTNQALTDMRKAVDDEGNARQKGETEVRQLIEELAVGGLHLELMGLVWLLVGTVVVW